MLSTGVLSKSALHTSHYIIYFILLINNKNKPTKPPPLPTYSPNVNAYFLVDEILMISHGNECISTVVLYFSRSTNSLINTLMTYLKPVIYITSI